VRTNVDGRNIPRDFEIIREDYRARKEYFGGVLFFRPRPPRLFLNEIALDGFQTLLRLPNTAAAVEDFSQRNHVSWHESARFYRDLINEIQIATRSQRHYENSSIELPGIDSLPIEERFLAAPVYFSWEITDQCNFPCVYCSTNAKMNCGGPPASYSQDDAFDIAERVIRADIFHVFFTGGEPLLVPYVFALAKRLLEGQVTITIATNGSLIENRISEITELANAYGKYFTLQVKLDTVQPSQYQRLTGTDASVLESVLRALELLDSRQVGFVVQAAFTPDTKSDLKRIVQWLAGLPSCKEFNINAISQMGRGKAIKDPGLVGWTTQDKIAFLEQIAELIGVRESFMNYSQLVNEWFPINPPDQTGAIHDCKAGRMYLRLKYNRRLSPCNVNREIELCELSDKSIDDIWNDDALAELRRYGLKCPLRLHASKDREKLLQVGVQSGLVYV
jgi:MoaA/NifB/PqqE/SkfB family radical SAM enzyme